MNHPRPDEIHDPKVLKEKPLNRKTGKKFKNLTVTELKVRISGKGRIQMINSFLWQ